MGTIHIKVVAECTNQSDYDWITGKLNEAKLDPSSLIETVTETVPSEEVVGEFDVEVS